MTRERGTDARRTGGATRQGLKSARKRRTLSGLRILVGRARHQASGLSSGLRNLGAGVIEIPFIEIRKPRSYRPLDRALKNLRDYDWLILTSVNGVDAFWKGVRRRHIPRKEFTHLQVAAIGPATRKAIEKGGLRVEVVPPEYVAESVVESLRTHVGGKRVLLTRAKVARDVIPRELRKLGAKVDVVEAYETAIPRASRIPLRALLNDPKRRPHIITFTSSSSVRSFVSLVGKPVGRGRARSPKAVPWPLERIRMASIGPVTSSTLLDVGLPVDIEAQEYTIPGLIRAIVAARSTLG
ncbi:MAG TPA: uroporphyrinogen-III synthase [Terriglobales bacterium]|nr:uroporphyrinogen-III synthase [Terriglobales bacterium]